MTYDPLSHDEYLRVLTYLKEFHPFPPTWDQLKSCALYLVEDGPYLAGVVYFHWYPGADHVVELHMAALPRYHGRWMTRRLFGEFFATLAELGVKGAIGHVVSPLVARLYQKAGFTITGPLAYTSIGNHGTV